MRPGPFFTPLKQGYACRKDTLRNSGPKVKKGLVGQIFSEWMKMVSLYGSMSSVDTGTKQTWEMGNCTKAHQISSQWGKDTHF